MAKNSTIDIERLARLEPISALSNERLEELAKLAYIERVSIGVSLFREGDLDNQTLYLLQGDVQLSSSDGNFDEVISSRQNTAKFPLDDSQPRQVSCVALGLVEFLRIDNSVLDYMMMWDQLAVQEELFGENKQEENSQQATTEEEKVSEQALKNEKSQNQEQQKMQPTVLETMESDSNDLETDKQDGLDKQQTVESNKTDSKQNEPAAKQSTPLQKPDVQQTNEREQFAAIEISNAETAAGDEETLPVEKGAWMRRMRHIMAFKNLPPANIKELLDRMETVNVHKGDTIVQQGEAGDSFYVLTDGEAQVTRTIELAQLKAGASFGEESLVSGGQRNASITMMTDGVLMKLSKQDFDHLLKEPMLNRVSPEEAKLRALKGDIWLDVRHASEYHHSSLPKANNIPLHEIRMRMDELDKNKQYICYCNTGRRSSAAAFILAQAGYRVSVLNGGVRVMPQDLVKK